MAGTGSPAPFIKNEPEDFDFSSARFMGQNGYDMSQHYGGQHSGHMNGQSSVNPSDLTMSGSFMNSQFGSDSFTVGGSRLPDEDLLDLINIDDSNNQHTNLIAGNNGYGDQGHAPSNQSGYFHQSVGGGAASVHQQAGQLDQLYTNTPDNAPIASPFVHSYNFNQFRMQPQPQGFPHSFHNTGMQNGFGMVASARTKMQRQTSDSRSPMTPKTPALGALHLGTPESGSFPGQPIPANHRLHGHQRSMSNQWEDTPGSLGSWVDSPLPSPNAMAMHHAGISEVLTSGHPASMPAKVENGSQSSSVPAYQSQEAKRRRRRESHNLVERRRRDNINERIHDLSRLVPQHRLEDEKVRKHIHSNGPLSPTIAAHGISPPQATSLLAGGNGRRAAGNITQGLPVDDKDKGPNKGDILNGAVGWTRDLMWMLNLMLQREEELKRTVSELGGQWPFHSTEDEERMRTELTDALRRNGRDNFMYTRGPGSGLRVPKHTNIAGEPLHPSGEQPPNSMTPQSLSPAIQSGGSGANSGGQGQPQFWMNHSNRDSFSLKEEDEFGMEMS